MMNKVCVGCQNYTLRMMGKCKNNIFLEKELCPVFRRRKFLDIVETLLIMRNEQAAIIVVAGDNKEPHCIMHENFIVGGVKSEHKLSLFALVVVGESEAEWKQSFVKDVQN